MLQDMLTEKEFDIVKTCLIEWSTGPYIEDWEFFTVTGFEREAFKPLLEQWPNIIFGKIDKSLILQSIGQLRGYPHEMDERLERKLKCNVDELWPLFEKIKSLPSNKTPYLLD